MANRFKAFFKFVNIAFKKRQLADLEVSTGFRTRLQDADAAKRAGVIETAVEETSHPDGTPGFRPCYTRSPCPK